MSVETQGCSANGNGVAVISEASVLDARLFDDIFGLSPAAVFITQGPDHKVHLANQAMLRLAAGHPLLRRTVAQVLEGHGAADIVALLDSVFAAGKAATRQAMPVCFRSNANDDVELRYVNFAFAPIRGIDGNVSGILAQGVDVTEQVHARFEAEAANRRLRALIETSGLVVWTGDLEGGMAPLGEAFRSFTGAPPEAGDGWNWTRFVHPEDLEEVVEDWKDHLASPRAYSTSFRARRGDGEWRRLNVSAVPVYDDQGRHVEWVGSCADVEDQRRAEHARRETQTELALALEASRLGNWSRRLEDDAITLSPRAREIFGVSDGEVVDAAGLFSRIHPDDHERVIRQTQDALDKGIPFESEYRLVFRDGTQRWVHSQALLERDDAGRPRRLVGTAADTTAKRRYEEELIGARRAAEELARLKDAFLANMSHEIRTPLTSIIGYAELLLAEATGDLREMAGYIHANGFRLMHTLDLVLELAQLESGLLQLQPRSTDVAQHVRGVAEGFRPQAIVKGLQLDVACSSDRIRANIDSGALSRVLGNLLTNAIKFTPAGSITVTVSQVDTYLQIAVTDTGIGIEAEAIPRLFNEFMQESRGLSREYEGAGIGLSITSKLVKLMGGSIMVESERGQGSSFTVHLPLDPPDAVEARSSGDLPQMLVVEDQDDARFLIHRMLRDVVGLHFATSDVEALAAINARTYDLVLMDINLGDGMDGEALLRHIRSRPDRAGVPVIACTAYAQPGDRHRFLQAGFDGYVSKPFQRETLLQAIDAWMNVSERRATSTRGMSP